MGLLEPANNQELLSHQAGGGEGRDVEEAIRLTDRPLESKSWQPTKLDAPVRQLKIEAAGDFWKGLIIPKIRLAGRWLERAGFNPGSHVHVTCLAPGVMEVRSLDALLANDPRPPAPAEPDCPF